MRITTTCRSAIAAGILVLPLALTSGCALVVGNRGLGQDDAQKELKTLNERVEKIDDRLAALQETVYRNSPEGNEIREAEIARLKEENDKLRGEIGELKGEKDRLLRIVESRASE